MKSSTKKFLLASLLAGSLVTCAGTVHAESWEDIAGSDSYSDNTVEIGTDYVEINGRRGTYANGSWEFAGRSGTFHWRAGENVFKIHGGNSLASAQTIGYNFITINGIPATLLFDDGETYYGNLIGNRITLNGANFALTIEDEYPTFNGTMSENFLRINGGTFTNYYSAQPGLTAAYNTVEVDGGANISNAYLFGGILGDAGTAYGNTLNINGTGYSAKNIYNFDTINFSLSAATRSGDTALTLTEGSTDFSNRAINAVIFGGTTLTTGDTVTLLANSNGLNLSGTSMSSRFAEGVTLTYDTDLIANSNGLNLRLGAAHIEDQTRALNQGALVSTGDISRNTGKIMDALRVEDFEPDSEDSSANANLMMLGNSFGFFGNMSGGKVRTKTGHGSYVESKGSGFNLGLARILSDPTSAPFIIAPMFDYGKNSYDSYLADGTHGHGDSKYFLGGLFVRKMNKSGFYLEGSFRGGKADTNFSSNDFIMGSNRVHVGYSDSTPAFAGHIRLGKLQRLNRNNLLHVYGLYSHTRVNGMDTKISTGERYHFNSVDNGTFMLGYRLTTRTSRISRIYTGLALQYQFNGKTEATYRGYTTAKAQIKGASGMLELGWLIKPNQNNPWMLDLNATGWVGQQRGVSATFKLQKGF